MKHNEWHSIAILIIAMTLTYAVTTSSCKCVAAPVESVPRYAAPTTLLLATTADMTAPSTSTETTVFSWPLVTESTLPEAAGRWGSDDTGTWAYLTSRAIATDAGIPWALAYPWQLQFMVPTESPEAYDCGLFSAPEPSGWFLGYCMGGTVGTPRRAHRVELRRTVEPEEMLHVALDDVIFLVVDRPLRRSRPE
jgi:hypothetical protein